MRNRRDFLKTVAGATTGMLLAGRAFAEAAQQAGAAAPALNRLKRRRGFHCIGGKRVKVVDVHAHCVIPEVWDIVKDTSLAASAGGRARGPNLMGPDRIRAIDQLGIDVQVLSINGFWFYAATDRDLAAKIVKLHDEKLAEWCSAHSDRYVALSSVALQFPDLAADQLEYAVKKLGARGAAIGGHVMGEDISLPKSTTRSGPRRRNFGVVVFMQPAGRRERHHEGRAQGKGRPRKRHRESPGNHDFPNADDVQRCVRPFSRLEKSARGSRRAATCRLISGGRKWPARVRPNADCANKKQPSDYLKSQVLVDTIVHFPGGLAPSCGGSRHGAGRLWDRYAVQLAFQRGSGAECLAPFLSDAEKEAILGGTLVKLLRI